MLIHKKPDGTTDWVKVILLLTTIASLAFGAGQWAATLHYENSLAIVTELKATVATTNNKLADVEKQLVKINTKLGI